MVRGCRWILFVCVMATGLTLAGCSDRQDNYSSAEKPADPPPVSEQADTRVPVDVAPGNPEKSELAPIVEKKTQPKPLDLSMPPQPVVAPDPAGSIDAPGDNLLPDLFQQEQKPDDGRSTHFRGRVLLQEKNIFLYVSKNVIWSARIAMKFISADMRQLAVSGATPWA